MTGTAEQPPLSTIPRDITAPKRVVFEPVWDPADIVPSETREAERFVPFKTTTVLTTTGGKRLTARIINVSRTGVAVESAAVSPQDIAMVGTRPVTPGRRITLGMVFLFKKPARSQGLRPRHHPLTRSGLIRAPRRRRAAQPPCWHEAATSGRAT